MNFIILFIHVLNFLLFLKEDLHDVDFNYDGDKRKLQLFYQ